MIDPEEIEWEEGNQVHATRHGVSIEEIAQVFANGPIYQRNRRQRSGDYMAKGSTDGGRRICVVFAWDEGRHAIRPVTAWPINR